MVFTKAWDVIQGFYNAAIPNIGAVKDYVGDLAKDEKNVEIAKKVAIGAGLATVTVVGVPLVVGQLGFGAAGVTAKSIAASYQSAYLGGIIAKGSVFAGLQSVGAAGLATATKVGAGRICMAVPFVKVPGLWGGPGGPGGPMDQAQNYFIIAPELGSQ